MKLIICAFVAALSLPSFAWETKATGDSHIEYSKEFGRTVVFISGDSAKALYDVLKSKEGYQERVVTEDRPSKGALELKNLNDFTDWYCMKMTDEVDEKVKSQLSDVYCRSIPVYGEI